MVHTDENRLRQILINLLSNAIKFTEAGQVAFRVNYRYQVAEFEIEDTGIGIHQRDLERIFQPFERARTARAKATAGTGLGLTITKLLTERHGRRSSPSRATVGKGSSFRVKLLLSEVSRPRIASTQEDRVRGYVGPRQTRAGRRRQRGPAEPRARHAGAARLHGVDRIRRARVPDPGRTRQART